MIDIRSIFFTHLRIGDDRGSFYLDKKIMFNVVCMLSRKIYLMPPLPPPTMSERVEYAEID